MRSVLEALKVSFWSGRICNSQTAGVDQGPAYPQLSQVCNPIPSHGFTQSFDFEVANGDYTYVLGLHQSDDCSDSGGSYQGLPNQPICEPTSGGFTHYSIHTLAAISRREPEGERALTSGQRANSALDKRQDVAYLAFGLTAGIASAHFFNTGIGECTAVAVDGGTVEKVKCGSNLSFGAIFGFITAYGVNKAYRGTRQATGPTARMRRGSSEVPLELGEDFQQSLLTPFPFTNIIDGYSGVIDHSANVTDHEGKEWIHWAITHTHTESERTFGTVLKYNPKSGTHIMASDPQDIVVEDTAPGLKKRAGQQITAYYGWRKGANFQSIPTDRATVDDLAAQVYDYGFNKNLDQYCANLEGGTSGNSFSRTLTRGNFALTNSIFSDQSANC